MFMGPYRSFARINVPWLHLRYVSSTGWETAQTELANNVISQTKKTGIITRRITDGGENVVTDGQRMRYSSSLPPWFFWCNFKRSSKKRGKSMTFVSYFFTILTSLSGIIHQMKAEYEAALKFHKAHLSFAQELSDYAAQGRAYGNMGNAYHALGIYDQAVRYHRQELQISLEVSVAVAAEGGAGN